MKSTAYKVVISYIIDHNRCNVGNQQMYVELNHMSNPMISIAMLS